MPYCLQAWNYAMDAIYRWTTNPFLSFQKGEEFLRKALSLDDRNAFAHSQLCNMYLMKRRYEKSVAQGKRAIELGPNLFQAYVELGRALVFAGKPNEAIPVLQTAIRLNPLPDTQPYLLLGVAYRDLGQHEKAITMSKKGLSISPNHMVLHLLLASVYSLSGQEENARAEAAEVLRVNPRFSLEYWSKILPYKNQADLGRVVNAWRNAGLK